MPNQDYPFDLQTDRYLVYDSANPAATVEALSRALKETLASSRSDSPVYQLLPQLKAPDPSVLKVVPRDFGEEVQRARREGRRGDLRLLAYETHGKPWESEGLRAVGRAQFALKAHGGAKETFQRLLEANPKDVEANLRLATVYQKLGDITRSEIAIERVIDSRTAAAISLRRCLHCALATRRSSGVERLTRVSQRRIRGAFRPARCKPRNSNKRRLPTPRRSLTTSTLTTPEQTL